MNETRNIPAWQKTRYENITFCWPCIMLCFFVNDQRDAQFFTMYLFLFSFLTLYMFLAHRAHHQERQIVSIQPLLTVTLCRWPCRVQVGSSFTWWWAWCARNM
jgi:ABC-type multidrug transport system permease subunit